MPRRYPLRGWIIGILSGIIAVAALIIGSVYGNVHAATLNPKIIAWACAAGLVMFGILATARLSLALGHLAARQSVPAAEGAVRFISSAVGYLIVLFGTFEVLDVSVQRLLVGAGVAGVVLGIAAQQSLGNIFAGLVLIMARPFVVGDHIRIRSGALGGMFDAWVQEMSLTYVTVQTDDGQFKIPNTAMLAAGVGAGASRERHDHTGAALRGDAEHGTGQCGADKRGARQHIAAQHCGARCSAGQHCAGQHRAGQHCAGQHCAGQHCAGQHCAGQHCAAQTAPTDAPGARAGTGTVQTGTVQTGTVQTGTVQTGFVPPSEEPGGV